MSYFAEYIDTRWRQSAKNHLRGLLLHESKCEDDTSPELQNDLRDEQSAICAEFSEGTYPCIPGDELERQWAREESFSERQTADAYVCLNVVPEDFLLVECKYRVQAGKASSRERKVRKLFNKLAGKFSSSRKILTNEKCRVANLEVALFNANSADELRDALESYCIESSYPVFGVIATDGLKRLIAKATLAPQI